MAAWKMIGFPGARYDYRDWVERHNERYPLPPVSIAGRECIVRSEPDGRQQEGTHMATKLPATDVVIIGLGWTGSILAPNR